MRFRGPEAIRNRCNGPRENRPDPGAEAVRKKKVAKSPKNWRQQRTKYSLLNLSKSSLVVIFIKQFYEKE